MRDTQRDWVDRSLEVKCAETTKVSEAAQHNCGEEHLRFVIDHVRQGFLSEGPIRRAQLLLHSFRPFFVKDTLQRIRMRDDKGTGVIECATVFENEARVRFEVFHRPILSLSKPALHGPQIHRVPNDVEVPVDHRISRGRITLPQCTHVGQPSVTGSTGLKNRWARISFCNFFKTAWHLITSIGVLLDELETGVDSFVFTLSLTEEEGIEPCELLFRFNEPGAGEDVEETGAGIGEGACATGRGGGGRAGAGFDLSFSFPLPTAGGSSAKSQSSGMSSGTVCRSLLFFFTGVGASLAASIISSSASSGSSSVDMEMLGVGGLGAETTSLRGLWSLGAFGGMIFGVGWTGGATTGGLDRGGAV